MKMASCSVVCLISISVSACGGSAAIDTSSGEHPSLGTSALMTKATCGDRASPVLSVADFNGDGVVDGADLTQVTAIRQAGQYHAFFDRNGDGVLDIKDQVAAEADLGKRSTPLDQKKAQAFKQIAKYDRMAAADLLASGEWLPGTSSLAGHGMHWIRVPPPGLPVGAGFPLDFTSPIGLNVSGEDGKVHGVYYVAPGIPLFNNGHGGLDRQGWPDPTGAWTDKSVQAFLTSDGTAMGTPLTPDLVHGGTTQVSITGLSGEKWHTHAGYCVTTTTADLRRLIPGTQCSIGQTETQCEGHIIHEYTTWKECQSLPSKFKNPDGTNVWLNIWMLHAWFFDLNPEGFFGGTHPCVDASAEPERPHGLDGTRQIPAFFQHMMH